MGENGQSGACTPRVQVLERQIAIGTWTWKNYGDDADPIEGFEDQLRGSTIKKLRDSADCS